MSRIFDTNEINFMKLTGLGLLSVVTIAILTSLI